MLCSVVKHAESGIEHEISVGRYTRRGRVFTPTSWVLYRFLVAFQQNSALSRFLSLFYDKQSIDFPTHWAEFSNLTLLSRRVKMASAYICSLSFHSTTSDAGVKFDSGVIFLVQSQFFATHSNQRDCFILHRQ